MKAFLVDEPADEQDEALIRLGEARPQRVQVRMDGLQVPWLDPVRDHCHSRERQPEHIAHVALHVVRAGDDCVGAVDHRAFNRVDVGLRVLFNPALMAPELRGVNRG
jgi:hypothetical protein